MNNQELEDEFIDAIHNAVTDFEKSIGCSMYDKEYLEMLKFNLERCLENSVRI